MDTHLVTGATVQPETTHTYAHRQTIKHCAGQLRAKNVDGLVLLEAVTP